LSGQAIGTAVPLADPSIKTRFTTLRLHKVAKKFSGKQISYVKKYGFETFLHLPKHFRAPLVICQYIADNTGVMGRGLYQKREKKIRFSKQMVNRIFGFSSGSIPFVFGSDDIVKKQQVKAISQKYLVGGQISMKKLVKALLEDESELGFMRSFILLMIGTILCPRTYDSLSPKYLFSLLDSSNFRKLDYGALCISHLESEIDTWRDKVFEPVDVAEYSRLLPLGGCLPVMAVCFCYIVYHVCCFFTVTILLYFLSINLCFFYFHMCRRLCSWTSSISLGLMMSI
jgi:hypothetical protein